MVPRHQSCKNSYQCVTICPTLECTDSRRTTAAASNTSSVGRSMIPFQEGFNHHYLNLGCKNCAVFYSSSNWFHLSGSGRMKRCWLQRHSRPVMWMLKGYMLKDWITSSLIRVLIFFNMKSRFVQRTDF